MTNTIRRPTKSSISKFFKTKYRLKIVMTYHYPLRKDFGIKLSLYGTIGFTVYRTFQIKRRSREYTMIKKTS